VRNIKPTDKPTSAPEPLIVDPKVAQALERYAERVGGFLTADEVVYRAVLCYLTAQNTPYAWQAVNEAGFFPPDDANDFARPDTGEFDGPEPKQ
jgi:hypothetical protein